MTIKISSIETTLVDLPTIRPHILSMTAIHRQTMTIVKIICDDGTVGIGEATTIGGLSYVDESPEGIKLAIDTYFTPLLVKCDADDISGTMAVLGRHIVGNHFAKCAIETALFDAKGKRDGKPVSHLLTNKTDNIRSVVPVLWTLASGNTKQDIEEAEAMIESRRHNVFKLKIGKQDIDQDIAHVGAIKRALGDQISIRVDVNQVWGEAEAANALARLAEVGVDLVEQPISRHNIDGMARLATRSDIAVMADEALRGPVDALRYAKAGAANVFALKIAQSGGLRAGKRVSKIADAAKIDLYGGTMLEGPIGTIASAHLFATLPNLQWGTELFGPLLLAEDILAEPLIYKDFHLKVPIGPGLGITLDEDRLAFFTRGRDARRMISLPNKKKA